MFAALPSEIIRTILADFVDVTVVGLSKLDRAMLNQNQRSHVLDSMATVKPNETRRCTPSEMDGYLSWIASRRFKVSQLHIDPQRMQEVVFLVPDLKVPQVQRLYFQQSQQDMGDEVDFISPFLSMLPGLRLVDCSRWSSLTDLHLTALMQIKCPPFMEALHLKGCHFVSSEVVSTVLAWLTAGSAEGRGLREVSCDVLEDQAIADLAGLPAKLRAIRLACDRMQSADPLQQLCAGSAEHLEVLELHSLGHHLPPVLSAEAEVINTNLIQRITSGCQRLTTVVLPFERMSLFVPIFTNCQHLQYVQMGHTKVRIATLASGKKVCDVEWGHTLHAALLLAACTSINLPIRKFIGHIQNSHANDQLVNMLAEKYGPELEELVCVLGGDVTEHSLRNLFTHCSNLQVITANCHTPAFTDAVAAVIPTSCHQLRTLELNRPQFTEAATIAMLEAFTPDQLTSVSLKRCAALTDATLTKIAQRFPNLTYLGMTDTAITKETVHALILAGSLRANVIDCPESWWVLANLQQANFHPIPFLEG